MSHVCWKIYSSNSRNLESLTKLPKPGIKALHTLDAQMQDILKRPDLPEDTRVKLYNQTLQRYLNYHEQEASKPLSVEIIQVPHTSGETKTSITDADQIEQEILESVPKTMKKKAQLLVSKIKMNPDMKWNERGELVYKESVVPNTNMVDLVNDALRRRKTFQPEGWKRFAQGLKEMNVPQDLIGHRERWNWMQQEKAMMPSTISETPIRKKRKRVVSTAAKKIHRWTPY